MLYLFSCALLNSYICVILDSDGNKSLIMHDQHILLFYYYYFIIIIIIIIVIIIIKILSTNYLSSSSSSSSSSLSLSDSVSSNLSLI